MDESSSSIFRSNDEIQLEAKRRKQLRKVKKEASFQLLRWQKENQKQFVRTAIYNELRAFEARRRTAYSSKLENTQLYFTSLVDILQTSLDETAKLYRLALGTSMAQSQYARAITQRGSHQAPRDSSPSSALLHSWQESNTLLAATLEESAVDIQTNVVSTLAEFLEALVHQKEQFESVGRPIMEQLDHMEKQVRMTWGRYKEQGQAMISLACKNLFLIQLKNLFFFNF